MDTIEIHPRFRGPPTSGNGGYVCGRLASFIHGPAAVSLKVPPPLGTKLEVRREGESVSAYWGDVLVGTAAPADIELSVPELPDAHEVLACRDAYLAEADAHLLPDCFVCGPRREEGDGLRLFAGLREPGAVAAAAWRPTADLADEDGFVRAEFLWSALDCPSYFSLGLEGRLALLARLTAKIESRPRPGDALTVIAWPSHHDERKHFAHSAVVSESGRPLAVANALWIEVTDPALRAKLLSEP